MRARVLFPADRARFREELRLCQQVLGEVAVAFGHSLVMKETDLSDEAMESAVEQTFASEAAMLAASPERALAFAKRLGCFAGLRPYDFPTAAQAFSRLKSGELPAGAVVWPLSGLDVQLNKAAVAAVAQAAQGGEPLLLSPPKEQESAWNSAASRAAMCAAQPAPAVSAMEDVFSDRLTALSQRQTVMASHQGALLLDRLLCHLGGCAPLSYTVYLAEDRCLHVPELNGRSGLYLFSMLYAAADLLRRGLKLEREADCLKTAVDNVLTSGWRTGELPDGGKTVPAEEIVRLVSEQVALAGELFDRLG